MPPLATKKGCRIFSQIFAAVSAVDAADGSSTGNTNDRCWHKTAVRGLMRERLLWDAKRKFRASMSAVGGGKDGNWSPDFRLLMISKSLTQNDFNDFNLLRGGGSRA